jgi:hypothetical protein
MIGSFTNYLTERKPLLVEAANLIALNINAAIQSCKNLAHKNKSQSFIYESISKQLSEYDYEADRKRIDAIKAKEAEDKAVADKAAADKKAAEDAEEERKKSTEIQYSHSVNELIRMLQHVGAKLKEFHGAHWISQDYDDAIYAMITDLQGSARRGAIPKTGVDKDAYDQNKTARFDARKSAGEQGWSNDHAAVRHLSGINAIIKILGLWGLKDISDGVAAYTYKQLYAALSKIKNPKRAIISLGHWLRNSEFPSSSGIDDASDDEIKVMHCLLGVSEYLGYVPTPNEAETLLIDLENKFKINNNSTQEEEKEEEEEEEEKPNNQLPELPDDLMKKDEHPDDLGTPPEKIKKPIKKKEWFATINEKIKSLKGAEVTNRDKIIEDKLDKAYQHVFDTAYVIGGQEAFRNFIDEVSKEVLILLRSSNNIKKNPKDGIVSPGRIKQLVNTAAKNHISQLNALGKTWEDEGDREMLLKTALTFITAFFVRIYGTPMPSGAKLEHLQEANNHRMILQMLAGIKKK